MKTMVLMVMLVGCSNAPCVDKYSDPVHQMQGCKEMCSSFGVQSFSPEQSGLFGGTQMQCKCVVKEK